MICKSKMKKHTIYTLFTVLTLVLSLLPGITFSQSGASENPIISYKGQLSGVANIGTASSITLGGRYIPQFNFEAGDKFTGKNNLRYEFEAAANIYSNAEFFRKGEMSRWDGDIKLYRGWGKIATNRSELRVGLQKINFGSATILRPLMWFDSMDSRDPLQLTDGVWGGLGRYFFADNSNLWLWVLYGNNKSRGFDIGITSQKSPEYGGRFQKALPSGEAALTFHHRKADLLPSSTEFRLLPELNGIPENRLGLDAKFDVTIGLWVEASWVNKSQDLGMFTNQHMVNIGADYTFGIGNGLNLIFEHLIISFDRDAFKFSNRANISALSANYPLSMSDNLNIILYYDWENGGLYNFANWRHNIKNFSFHVMGYVNPMNNDIPLVSTGTSLYSGNGIQFMLVYTHKHSTKR